MNEREFELVNIIGDELSTNQRDLSRRMDLSLGMVNMLLRRLIAKGYIRINQLNKRKVEYLLTPKGFSEKMQKSVRYTLKTIQSIGKIKNQLNSVLSPFVKKGVAEFAILGSSDFALLVEAALKDLGGEYKVRVVGSLPVEKTNELILICEEEVDLEGNINQSNIFNLVEELARDYHSPRQPEGAHS